MLVRVTGTKQHYLPASLIGGFGRPAASGRLREATVAVRRKATGNVTGDILRQRPWLRGRGCIGSLLRRPA
jgi:hypothetical protein